MMSASISEPRRLTTGRMIGFTFGDFGCNIFWQSISLFLLFFYTDTVGLSAGTAGIIYMVASIWDGASDPIMGAIADHTRTKWGRYRPYLLFGPIPLAVSFAFLYYKPNASPFWLVAILLASHMAFRSCYTIVSIPYTSLSARITSDTRQRSTVAGFRMIFAMAAGLAIAFVTQPLVSRFGGHDGAKGYFLTAIVLGLVSLVIFPIVFLSTKEPPEIPGDAPTWQTRKYWTALKSNRAFWVVMAAIGCTVGCQTAIGKSILYYFKYYLHDEASARYALTLCSASGLVIIPCWMLVERLIGKRAAWFAATALGLLGFIYFALTNITSAKLMIGFLLFLQVPLLGMAMTFWSMLPDTVEYGEWRTGIRAESFIFGLGQFFLKAAFGIAAGIFGEALEGVGFVPNAAQSSATLEGMKSIMVVFPIILLALGGVAMFFYPLRKGDHEHIIRDLASGKAHDTTAPVEPQFAPEAIAAEPLR